MLASIAFCPIRVRHIKNENPPLTQIVQWLSAARIGAVIYHRISISEHRFLGGVRWLGCAYRSRTKVAHECLQAGLSAMMLLQTSWAL